MPAWLSQAVRTLIPSPSVLAMYRACPARRVSVSAVGEAAGPAAVAVAGIDVAIPCGAEIAEMAVNVEAGCAAPIMVGVGCAVTWDCGRGDAQASATISTT